MWQTKHYYWTEMRSMQQFHCHWVVLMLLCVICCSTVQSNTNSAPIARHCHNRTLTIESNAEIMDDTVFNRNVCADSRSHWNSDLLTTKIKLLQGTLIIKVSNISDEAVYKLSFIMTLRHSGNISPFSVQAFSRSFSLQHTLQLRSHKSAIISIVHWIHGTECMPPGTVCKVSWVWHTLMDRVTHISSFFLTRPWEMCGSRPQASCHESLYQEGPGIWIAVC